MAAAEALPRPEPIPVLATSLFAASLAHRVEPNPPVVAEEDSASEDESASDGLTAEHRDDGDDGDDGDDSGPVIDDPGPPLAAAVPLLLLTDLADPPTGAVQVANEPESAAAAALEGPVPTAEMPVAPIDPTPSGILYDEEQPKRSWGKYLVFGLIALIGIGLLSYAGWLLLRTKSYEVPDLTGVEEAVALNEIAGNGWVVETERERSDEVPEIDHVVRTVPVAGEMLDEGETFVIVVSDGFELRTLPELTGMPVTDAVATLTELRLVPSEAPGEFSEDVPAGSVIRWQVQGNAALTVGAQVLPDTVIVITPSLGPEPRPAPELVNLTAAEATAALDALQLVTAQGEDVFSNDIEVGRVVVQAPAPGTPVERGGTVTIQLSKGPDLVIFPDLTGLTYPAAQTALADAGYAVNSLLGTTEGIFVSASVAGEEIQAGATFPRGTGVDLIFL